MDCPNCGGTVPPGVNRCAKCGSFVEQPAAASPPPSPGVAPQPQMIVQQVVQAPSPPKSKVAAGLLGIFLGGWGVHRFYLGYTGIGVAQLLLTIFGWLTACLVFGFFLIVAAGIWGFIEGIMILVGAINRDAAGQPLQ